MNPRIYLDHAATTPVRAEVVQAMLPFLGGAGAYNPSSAHSEGRFARAALDDARVRVARSLGARPREIVFTGGGSEADTLAIVGAARARRAAGRHLVTAATEHHAVLHAMDALRDDGWEVTVLPVGQAGRVDSAAFRRALRPDTVLASIMLANNEIGALAPIAELAATARANGTLFHSDAVAAAGLIPLDVDALGIDMLSLSAHKFYGPKGVGVLYVRSGTPVEPTVYGGGQESGLRSGTENVAGIVGLATALELAVVGLADTAARIGDLRDALEAGLLERVPDAVQNGARWPRLANNLSVRIPGADGEALLVLLDLAGIAASGGSACAAGSTVRSHVIAALGPTEPGAVVRFSLGKGTTKQEIACVLDRLPEIVAQVREHPTFVGTT